jgi:hypothetical protein
MAKWDGLRLLPDYVVAPLLRALVSIPRRPDSRLILVPVKETRPPFYDLRDDYNVMFRDRRVGRISIDHRPYPHEAHVPWRWFLNDTERNRMADGRTATREEAMTAFRKAFDTVPDDMVGRSA